MSNARITAAIKQRRIASARKTRMGTSPSGSPTGELPTFILTTPLTDCMHYFPLREVPFVGIPLQYFRVPGDVGWSSASICGNHSCARKGRYTDANERQHD